MFKKQCRYYVGVACVDGSCPIANADEYMDMCIPVIRSCDDCFLYNGCEDCALAGTIHCDYQED